ncbi:MAG: TrbI/VirB10 family protein [Sphingomonas sp.]|uniref:TrbI/VirB10 family protein n=1 Tax=Sphingomonas sp. TaxID=28214 RepID=UPI001AD59E28|nr:TrbI/VirB10 family protein [Sphingomonas sp.]MBN8816351.1 TrbI/VirB10 family protein [Sphingomonas sp.]
MSERDELARDPAEKRPPIATRAAAPTPRRLSRKALATLAGVSALGVAAALGYSLTTSHRTQDHQETVSVERRNTDALADAPKDYGDLARTASAGIAAPPTTPQPVTTPPLSGMAPASPGTANNEASAEQQRRRQQRDSARASKLFAGTSEGARSATASAEPPPPPGQAATGELAPAGNGDAQDRKAAFVAGGTREPTVNSGRLTAPAGRYVVSAGSTIAAALITGLSSDLPGQVVAQVTEDVFDTVTGRTRLIPQGTRLIGVYDARVSYGQSRALVVWTRLIFPDGRSLDLDRMVGTDAAGQSGLTDRVNNHTGKLLMAGLLSTLFGVGANAATTGGGDNADIAFAIRESAGRSVESAGDKIVSRQLDVQPTITVRPGARVRVLVSRDLVLSQWGEN